MRIFIVVLLLFGLNGKPDAQAPEQLQGTMASTAGGGFSGLARIRILIDEYTTDAEAQEVFEILANEGARALEAHLLRVEKGRFIRVGELGHNIAFARSFTNETGRIIRLATARPIAFAEAAGASRSRDYNFGVIELTLDNEGKGSGVLWAATKLEFDDEGQLEIESYGIPSLSITEISVQD